MNDRAGDSRAEKDWLPAELAERLRRQRERLAEFRGRLDVPGLRARLTELVADSAAPDLWSDRERAEQVLREKGAIERKLARFDAVGAQLDDAGVLLELAQEEQDAAALAEVAERLDAGAGALDEIELDLLLGGEHDASPAILSINAGAGGTDACDWAEMLLRMYLRWADAHGFGVEELDRQAGDEAGLRSVTILLQGDHPYGWLKTEQGVHRLVRISPFDANHRRQTAFAAVSVLPEVEDAPEVEIDEKDLRVDTFRSSGAGGQHVNKVESAIRITHLPTGIVVQCQNERSQHKNRSTAMKVLRARLWERARLEREAKMAALSGEKKEIGFGSQIRSYTLHPSQRVKDHRTDVEIGNADGVLDGDIDRFLRAALLTRAGASREPAGS
ncbi:MAG: peptide chain release factor 2 [Deltaproteobacteria bacterium]|nr:peptide chain release factor 2 [Deltaproteobacteria bacterium]